jgi:peptidoglycan/LPS O-acetylase OafA/YrhL
MDTAALFLACLGFTIGLAAVAFALIARPARRQEGES